MKEGTIDEVLRYLVLVSTTLAVLATVAFAAWVYLKW